jgi:hypothetical protein
MRRRSGWVPSEEASITLLRMGAMLPDRDGRIQTTTDNKEVSGFRFQV